MAYFSEEREYLFSWCEDDRQRSYNEVRQIFNETFCDENTVISRSTVDRTVFNETCNVKNHQFQDDQYQRLVKKNNWTIICRKFPPQHAQSKSATWH